MSQLILNRRQIRAVDEWAIRTLGIPGIVLMENAGRGAAELLLRLRPPSDRPVVICCGKGNNGGDGFVIARQLRIADVPVRVVIFHDPCEFAGDAATNLRVITELEISLVQLRIPNEREQLQQEFEHASWIVDALLGTGTTGSPRPPYAEVIREMNSSSRPVFAVDLPSGLDCDTGLPMTDTVLAQATATFAALKPGLLEHHAAPYVGAVSVVPIGLPADVLTRCATW